MYDYLVVGAGLYGATFASMMTTADKNVLVIDKRDHIGGNAYTEYINGVIVHKYGAHIFHTNDRAVWDYVNRYARMERYVHSPMANYNGEMYNLPFNMNTFNRIWGLNSPGAVMDRIDDDRPLIEKPRNLEEQAIMLVGQTIYEKLVKGYTEKQWGRPCSELPPEIIRRLPLRFTYDNDYFGDLYQAMPVGGYTPMVQNMLYDSEVITGVDFFDEKDMLKRICKKIVFTGPIDEFYGYRFGNLEYRSLRFEEVVMEAPDGSDVNIQGAAVVNHTSEKVPYTRIIEHKHFMREPPPASVYTLEYSEEWKRGKEPYYPIGDRKNLALYEKYKKLAACEENVTFGGRLGTYQYLNMDQVIGQAIRDARIMR